MENNMMSGDRKDQSKGAACAVVGIAIAGTLLGLSIAAGISFLIGIFY